jgi:feruloyl esterase
MKYALALLLPIPVALAAMGASGAGAAASCESLAQTNLPNAKITAAQSVPAGNFTVPGTRQNLGNLPAFCRVALTGTPSPQSDITIEVWLPSNWNGKFQAVGNGGWAGSISYPAMARALRAGYATTSTDTGHVGGTGEFALNQEKLIDYSWRSEHEMTLKAKALVQAHYGRGPQYSYWNGCSSGGRQGLKEAALYPNEYDAMVIGDPANLRAERNTWQMMVAVEPYKNPAASLSEAKVRLINQKVRDACDAQDGVRDGLLENPKTCRFDPAVLACQGGDAATCLTAPELASVRRILNPGRTASGTAYQPGLELGSEIGTYPGRTVGWSALTDTEGEPAPTDNFRYAVYKDARWDFRTFRQDEALAAAQKANAIETAQVADLAAFMRRGKILFYHGWADPSVAPQATIDYYNGVRALSPSAAESTRLFMVPGMGHCNGGEGVTDQFDAVAALDAWVTTDRAPQRIEATNIVQGQVRRSRPLCPYPQVARYDGTGSTDDTANFTCAAP